jgi:hypothetical protein
MYQLRDQSCDFYHQYFLCLHTIFEFIYFLFVDKDGLSCIPDSKPVSILVVLLVSYLASVFL